MRISDWSSDVCSSDLDYDEPPVSTGLAEADDLIVRIREVNPLRAQLVATYLREMSEAVSAIVRVLNPGGRLVLIAGGNRVAGQDFPTHHFLNDLVAAAGLEKELELVDDIRSRGLMPTRNRTAPVIDSERVSIFRKILDVSERPS